jgi:enoyl-CoA hydratase/carnithine racemase
MVLNDGRSEPASGSEPFVRDGDLQVKLTDGLLHITFNRPAKKNSLTREMLLDLNRLLPAAGADKRVRVILFTGAGDAFCAGADVSGLARSAATPLEERLTYDPHFTPRHCGIYKPSICAVNGICAGAGLHFVADCDIAIASDKASFVDTHVNVGQVTALEPMGLARRMPLDRVLRMVILGRGERLDAAQALEAHMVSEVLPAERLLPRALELAALACQGSPAAIETSLRVIWQSVEPEMEKLHRIGMDAVMRHRDHPDAAEGPRAFLEKRAPVWQD